LNSLHLDTVEADIHGKWRGYSIVTDVCYSERAFSSYLVQHISA